MFSETAWMVIPKLLAKSYFGDENKLVKIDMAEFMGKETVNKLIEKQMH